MAGAVEGYTPHLLRLGQRAPRHVWHDAVEPPHVEASVRRRRRRGRRGVSHRRCNPSRAGEHLGLGRLRRCGQGAVAPQAAGVVAGHRGERADEHEDGRQRQQASGSLAQRRHIGSSHASQRSAWECQRLTRTFFAPFNLPSSVVLDTLIRAWGLGREMTMCSREPESASGPSPLRSDGRSLGCPHVWLHREG